MNQFKFENTLKLTESQYLAVWAIVPARRISRLIRVGALAAVGIVFLFTPYTVVLGAILLGLIFLWTLFPRMIPVGARSLFHQHQYLRDALTYGVSEQKLWIKGARLDATVSWSMLVTWREREGWLVLSPSGVPPVYLSIARLSEEELYEQVSGLVRHNAEEFKTSGFSRAI